jgi:hypothetical protein
MPTSSSPYWLPSVLLLLTVGAVACSSAGGDEANATSGWADTGYASSTASDVDSAGAPTATSSDQAIPPAWYTLDGVLDLQGDSATLAWAELSFYDDGQQVQCIATYLASPLEASQAPEGEPIVGWWSTLLSDPTADGGDCGAIPAELPLTFGLGDYDARLDPALTAQGYDGSTPFALYQLAPDDTVWLTGIAGTEEHLRGRVEPVPEESLLDGSYELATLFLLPLP